MVLSKTCGPAPKPHEGSFLVTRSGRRLSRANLFRDRPYFPFLRLPPEIRNMIYGFVMGHASDEWIFNIISMYPDEFDSLSRLGRVRYRDPYQALITEDCESVCPHMIDAGDWTCKELTSYTTAWNWDTRAKAIRNSLGLVALNKQVRSEVIPILYGRSCLNLSDEYAVVPFLDDRTVMARQSIREVRLCMTILDDGHHLERQDQWIQNFEYIAANLRLTHLNICFIDFDGMLFQPGALEDPCVQFVAALAKIQGLRKLHVAVDFPICPEVHLDSSLALGLATAFDLHCPKKWMREFLEHKMRLCGGGDLQEERKADKPKDTCCAMCDAGVEWTSHAY